MRAEGNDMPTGYCQVLAHLQQSAGGLTDGQLLARFVVARDQAAFAALVRRHGPMVLGVCRRVLRHFHDAEDAFQATFLVLARKAASVVKGESLGCWLYQVAYHTALEAGAGNARRRGREKPMQDVPQPQARPTESRDWRPLLDRELRLLPRKYHAAVVLCDLEGKSRREASRQLGISEGTLSSRLARGRALLAKRLTRCGVVLSGGALAVALAEGAASATLPAALVMTTARSAVLVAAGQVATVSAPAILLMKGVMKAMLMKTLRLVVGGLVLVAALGAVGLALQAGGGSGLARAAPPDKPRSELEALKHENELLKVNLEVVLEKVRAQEAELRAFRAQRGDAGLSRRDSGLPRGSGDLQPGGPGMPGMGPPGIGGPGAMGPGRGQGPMGSGPGMAGPGGSPMGAGGPGGMRSGGGGNQPPGQGGQGMNPAGGKQGGGPTGGGAGGMRPGGVGGTGPGLGGPVRPTVGRGPA